MTVFGLKGYVSSVFQGTKRSRTGMMESFSQAGVMVKTSMQDAYNSDVNNSSMTGVEHEQVGWDWDDDDRGAGMDIQALLAEFGDFGDFFENDTLPFGEVLTHSFQLK